MAQPIILASKSDARRMLLDNAGVPFEAMNPMVDEVMIKAALLAEGAIPRDVADSLAEAKARKISAKRPDALVLGCDQVIDFDGKLIGKPDSPDALKDQLRQMRRRQHELLSAVVFYENAKPVWRHIGKVRMSVRDVSDTFLDAYVERNWEAVRHAAGGYMLEAEGVRLFSQVSGDYFTVLGLPLVEVLAYLGQRGAIEQ